tara:strand:- start:843 stop:1577 length:735 start_codon:yes stop_codon:yes gene_type:complete
MSSYCSIEEAWGDGFCKPTKPKKKRVILDGDDYYRASLPGKRRSKSSKRYKHTDIYDSHNYYADNSNINTNSNPYNEKNNFSRSMNRLPNHNGPDTRSMLQDIHYDTNIPGDYQGYASKDLLNYESIKDTPADSFKKIHNDIYECPDDDEIYNTDNESDGDPKETIESFSNLDNLSKSLDDNFKNTKPYEPVPDNSHTFRNLQNNSQVSINNTNNIYDLILYIFTGVFYLVLCDFVYKLGKKTY